MFVCHFGIVEAPCEIDISQIGNEPNRWVNQSRFDGEHPVEAQTRLIESTEPNEDTSAQAKDPVLNAVAKELMIKVRDVRHSSQRNIASCQGLSQQTCPAICLAKRGTKSCGSTRIPPRLRQCERLLNNFDVRVSLPAAPAMRPSTKSRSGIIEIVDVACPFRASWNERPRLFRSHAFTPTKPRDLSAGCNP